MNLSDKQIGDVNELLSKFKEVDGKSLFLAIYCYEKNLDFANESDRNEAIEAYDEFIDDDGVLGFIN